MTNETTVLLLGYYRPLQMRGLIQSLAPLKPKLILFSVDGPKANRPSDAELVRQTQELINEITWDAEIRTRFREFNLGLRRAVVDAVTWANSEYGKVIVLEDDVRAGSQLLDFLNHNLVTHRNNPKIAHVNGYNLVPTKCIKHPGSSFRLSIYLESYAWATWGRAWQAYDDDMTWARSASIEEIKSICGSTLGALRWKQNFADASAERIDTWAYRWLASMWEHRWFMVSPNRNIARYEGQFGGTHTIRKNRINQPIVNQIEISDSKFLENDIDKEADAWLGKVIYLENLRGVFTGPVVSLALKFWRSFSRRSFVQIKSGSR